MPNPKRSLEAAGNFDNYVDSVRTANVLDSIRQAKFENYKQVISNKTKEKVKKNKQDAKQYGPLAFFPIFYRAGMDIINGPTQDVIDAHREALNAQNNYINFVRPQKQKRGRR